MKSRVAVVVVSLLLAGLVASAGAQERFLRLQGRVLWTAGQTMILALDNGASVSIDLGRVPQSDLLPLAPNDYVLVTGVILRGSRQVMATSIQRTSPWYPESP